MPKGYHWVQSPSPGKPSDAEKRSVTEAFAPLIATWKAQLPPLADPQIINQCVDVKMGWRGSYFTVKGVFKCPPTPDFIKDGFESGVARLTYLSRDQFALSYFRHTGKWEVIYPSVSLAEAVESVKTEPWFEFF